MRNTSGSQIVNELSLKRSFLSSHRPIKMASGRASFLTDVAGSTLLFELNSECLSRV
jgi:hypothetical protein